MKIAILTHPLGTNYGGILQAYALSTYLTDKGHEVVVLNRQPELPWMISKLRALLILLRHPRYDNPRFIRFKEFVSKYINYSKRLFSTSDLTNFLLDNSIDSVIVGSDQVWRKSFAMRYEFNYFLDFVPESIVKCSYAASFGLSEWEYSEEQTAKIRNLLELFKNVSVRESDGKDLCVKYLGVSPEHVLDPTLLLDASFYKKIASKPLSDKPYIFVYWLGSETEKEKAIQSSYHSGLDVIDLSLRTTATLVSIEDWLSYIIYAERVITDSFHGCVFSILFKKQFSISRNDSGGNGRLNSLLKILNIDPASEVIDYSSVYRELELQRLTSFNFLNELTRH